MIRLVVLRKLIRFMYHLEKDEGYGIWSIYDSDHWLFKQLKKFTHILMLRWRVSKQLTYILGWDNQTTSIQLIKFIMNHILSGDGGWEGLESEDRTLIHWQNTWRLHWTPGTTGNTHELLRIFWIGKQSDLLFRIRLLLLRLSHCSSLSYTLYLLVATSWWGSCNLKT